MEHCCFFNPQGSFQGYREEPFLHAPLKLLIPFLKILRPQLLLACLSLDSQLPARVINEGE